ISEKCIALYATGRNLLQIARETGVPRPNVRQTLIEAGVAIRTHHSRPDETTIKAEKLQVGVTPFGYSRLRGRLVVEPKEIETVRLILNLWQAGRSLSAIAQHLDSHGYKTRKGGRWEHSIVRHIVLRHKDNPDQIEETIWESTNSSR
ncbi:MAG: recombinase family protein, partial [Deltaproteobacteria bacterium]|nr:recombinase family protein [Deltaproteobacteria bacterium]